MNFNEKQNISSAPCSQYGYFPRSKYIQYSDYKNFGLEGKRIGHFRVSQSLCVNCFSHKNEIFMIEFGEHSIEDNLGKYKNIIIKILQI